MRGGRAVAGAAAAAVALGVAELAAGVLPSTPSLLDAIGAVVIDAVPHAVVSFAVSTFGTSDKVALVIGTVVIALLLGAAAGVRTARSPGVMTAALAGAAIVGVAASMRDPSTSLVGTVAVAIVAVVAGRRAYQRMIERDGDQPGRAATSVPVRTSADGPPSAPGAPPPGDAQTVGTRTDEDAPTPNGAVPDSGSRASSGLPALPGPGRLTAEGDSSPVRNRREVLVMAGALGLSAGVAGLGGRRLGRTGKAAAARAKVALPSVRTPLRAAPGQTAFDVPGLSPLFTPNRSFYRIDTALVPPDVDPATWHLDIGGMVDRPFTITYDELLAMPMVEADITIACVSNPVGGDLVGTARWQGVPLRDLLGRAGIQPGADQIVGRSVDSFTAGFPVTALDDDRTALVAVAMNGEPLPVRHGFPARLVVAGLYGYVSATKWLSRIELTTFDASPTYWIRRGWAVKAPVKTAARIDVPHGSQRLVAGPVTVAGVAWAPTRGISTVEVRIDDGPWRVAELAAPVGDETWRQWRLTWQATAGRHRLQVRAVDGQGHHQVERRHEPFPDGATGYHQVKVRVAKS